METIDVQNKSFVVRWLKVRRGDTVSYQLKPLKKSIGFGIYRKLKETAGPSNMSTARGAPSTLTVSTGLSHAEPQVHLEADAANLMVEFRQRAFSTSSSSQAREEAEEGAPQAELQMRLDQSGLVRVSWVGSVQGNEIYQGTLMNDDYNEESYYAFVIDNTASKTVKKKVLFSASIVRPAFDAESVLSQDDLLHDYTAAASSTHMLAVPQAPQPSQSELFRLKQGRILQGYLLKKRRKRLQGFRKRFFKLDFKYGTLSYYLSERNSVCRGEIVISLSTVSASRKSRLIVVDSGMEIWALKARDDEEWNTWVESLEACYKIDSGAEKQPIAKELLPQDTVHGQAQTLMSEIQVAKSKVEEWKASVCYNIQQNEKVFTKPPTPQTRSDSRSSSLSSTKSPFRRNRNTSNADQYISVAFPGSSTGHSAVNTSNSSYGAHPTSNGGLTDHEVHRKLTELESLLANIALRSRMIFTSPIFASLSGGRLTDGTAVPTKSSTASIFSEVFFDALDDNAVIMLDDEEAADIAGIDSGSTKENALSHAGTTGSSKDDESDDEDDEGSVEIIEKRPPLEVSHTEVSRLYPFPIAGTIKRRDDIMQPNSAPPSLLAFLRKNVGKDLNSISMPMTSNEPITILQMMAETFEYAELLTAAATAADPMKRLALVAAFSISYLSIHREKARSMRKPVNPLLGETYELVREDKGYRLISEKVSHKPQIFAFHVEHKDWVCYYTISPQQKFWGKSLEFTNEGEITCVLKATGDKFVWSQPSMLLKNIIAGERYLEPQNQFEIHSSNGGKAVVAFKQGGIFSSRSEDLSISIFDSARNLFGTLKGQWTKKLVNESTGETVWEVGELVTKAPKKFGFTKFAANLNEITELEKDMLPPTDSRLRPDVRLYEAGDVDAAEELKLQLEQQQRERRNKGADVSPMYFRKSGNSWILLNGNENYWERRRRHDWSGVSHLW
ncbi:AaceriAGR356Wp [[Ashbya] aceris (nom. inval.)]|nr:AaceriAGR356Wp [[Ashbya] aceris (nom. inval.)]